MAGSIILTAFLLGILAFFEPCTIATHSLFIARSHKLTARLNYVRLVIVWVSRSLLVTSLLAMAVIFLPTPQWQAGSSSLLLIGMAVLYLVSRFVYIPVPHLKFHGLLPYNSYLPESIQLGLTLPACTLPLLVILLGISIHHHDVVLAMLTGIVFASGFSLPMLIAGIKGITKNGQLFLQKSATASPYITAVFLLAGALYLYLPHVDLSSKALRLSLEHASWTGIGLSFLAGFVFSFNPVSFASIPVMLAYVTKAHEHRRAMLMGSTFVLGMICTHVVLGVAAALGGEGVKSVLGREWGLVLGPILILLGLMWPGWIKLRLPWFGLRARKVSGVGGAFLLAIPFSVAVCPFCTPALLVTLTASAAIGSAAFGFSLLLAFALGRSIPVIIGAWSMGWLESLRILSRYQRSFEIIAGIVLVLTGLYLLNEYFFILEM